MYGNISITELFSRLHFEKEFLYSGISMSRQTMDNLMIAASDMLMPLYELIHRILLTFDIIGTFDGYV